MRQQPHAKRYDVAVVSREGVQPLSSQACCHLLAGMSTASRREPVKLKLRSAGKPCCSAGDTGNSTPHTPDL